jgi:hypothetical protein
VRSRDEVCSGKSGSTKEGFYYHKGVHVKNWEEWKEAEKLRRKPNKADAESSADIILRLRRRLTELTAQIEWLETGRKPVRREYCDFCGKDPKLCKCDGI